MRLTGGGGVHPTYCTNIHPGEHWPEVRAQLGRHLPEVRSRVAPGGELGIGLRLSGAAAEELEEERAFEEFRAFLEANRLYVFTINGFPFGAFHGQAVKDKVYLPDWRDPRRVDYSNRLARLLARLLPPAAALEGSVSTVPGAYRAHLRSADDLDVMAQNIVSHALFLHRLREETGRTVALALEPEPCCCIETTDEAIGFLQDRVFATAAARRFAAAAALGPGEAEAALRRHVGLCLDCCHAAVEYEDPKAAAGAVAATGIRIAKIQLSAGLRVPRLGAEEAAALAPFAEDTYLHQVIERRGERLTRYDDLPQALAAAADGEGQGPAREWRIHFHVPIWTDRLGPFENTQPFLREVLALHGAKTLSQHLEVETYSFGVLPEVLRSDDVVTNISRELKWVLNELR